MAEDERTVESTDDERETTRRQSAGDDRSADAADEAPTDAVSTPDDVAETFLELDDDLDLTLDTDQTGDSRRGLVVDADRVSTDEVPQGYPLPSSTDQAVALTVDFGEKTTTVYLAWPDEGDGETGLTWLLDAMGIELRDLYGREVLVDREDGHDVLVTPEERPRGSDVEAGVVAGLGVIAACLAVLPVAGPVTWPVLGLWLGVTLGWLPYATFRDAWYLRTHSDWDGGPAFWATLAALPVLNLFTGAAYLWQRARATFFGDQRSLLDRVSSTVRDWL